MFELFVGDIYQSLADEATKHSANATLITLSNVDSFLKTPIGVAYTSLGDIENLDTFLELCSKADKIYYRPPKKWSDIDSGNKSKEFTELVLAGLSQYITVDGIQKILDQKQYFNDDFLKDHRKTNSPQLWIAGCSVTYGVGVSKDQTFKEIVSQQLKLEYSDLSHPGSSIIWQSDQLCRSNLKTDDVVLWGLTGQHRLPVFDQKVVHLLPRLYDVDPQIKSKFPIDWLGNPTLMYHNILAVKRAYHFCQSVGAKLVILGLCYDFDNSYLYYDVPTLDS